jgi:hypothetical protein
MRSVNNSFSIKFYTCSLVTLEKSRIYLRFIFYLLVIKPCSRMQSSALQCEVSPIFLAYLYWLHEFFCRVLISRLFSPLVATQTVMNSLASSKFEAYFVDRLLSYPTIASSHWILGTILYVTYHTVPFVTDLFLFSSSNAFSYAAFTAAETLSIILRWLQSFGLTISPLSHLQQALSCLFYHFF